MHNCAGQCTNFTPQLPRSKQLMVHKLSVSGGLGIESEYSFSIHEIRNMEDELRYIKQMLEFLIHRVHSLEYWAETNG